MLNIMDVKLEEEDGKNFNARYFLCKKGSINATCLPHYVHTLLFVLQIYGHVESILPPLLLSPSYSPMQQSKRKGKSERHERKESGRVRVKVGACILHREKIAKRELGEVKAL